MVPRIHLLSAPNWTDYELLDSGQGRKLERFGAYVLDRPEVQAMWPLGLPAQAWQDSHAVFHPSAEESGGHWQFQKKIPEKWEMRYPRLRFWAMTTPGRHVGVFPEGAVHWDWMAERIEKADRPLKVLNLFGYTGLASLTAAAAGASVTHVDASKKSVSWGRENQHLSGLADRPVRWIVDDALKFVLREGRRESRYDGIILDPPKFGRGPKGEVWEVYKSLPTLLAACRAILSEDPAFVVLTVYAVKTSAVQMYYLLNEMMKGLGGTLEAGELVTEEKSAGRSLSQAIYTRWMATR
ncbi:MAG: class I SAM-dependent methyltransferase [Chloroflexota bacterium]